MSNALQSIFERVGSRFKQLKPTAPAGGRPLAQPLTAPATTRYLDPASLARFGLTPLVARIIVEGFITGLHRSPFHGFSVEFADHREYVPGDDLKFLDWPLYARTDHYYIKRFEDQTNVRCHILLDRSGSMGFGTGALTKWDYGCFLASALSYLMLRQQDAAGLTLVGDKPGVMVPPRARRTQLRPLMLTMVQNPPTGGTQLAESLRAVARTLKRRSLIVLISDLIDDPEPTLTALKLIGAHRHDLMVFHLLDAAEARFDFDGPTLFTDLETGEQLEVDPASVRDAYLEEMQKNQETFRRGLLESGIDYEMITTDKPYDGALTTYLQKRQRVGK